MNVNEITALEAIREIEAGRLTSETLVEACLERIVEREPSVGAWQFINPDQARLAARTSDKRPDAGALRGIPIAIKDLLDTADMPTTYGSPIYNKHRPIADASAVAKVRAEGGVIVGKTVTTEFAYFHPGKTTNPWDSNRTPGGSSSGSAAAVADFMVPLAIGSQTVGSTIRPASYCGVVGFKPSFGLIDRTGIRPLADKFDTIGFFARDVADIAHISSALSRRPNLILDQNTNTAPKIGICLSSEWVTKNSTLGSIIEHAARLAAKAGARINEITLPEEFSQVGLAQGLIVDYQAANSAAYELTFKRNLISDAYITRAEIGESYSAKQYDAALATIAAAQNTFNSIMEDFDVLMMPSATGEAPKSLKTTGDPICNRLGSAMHGPCLSVPGLTGPADMPVGIQLLGRLNCDKRLLDAGQWLFNLLNN